MNAFHIIGIALTLWALLVAALGIMQHDFPRTRTTERLIAFVSVILVLAAITAAVLTASAEEGAEEEGAKEGSAPALRS